MSRGDARKANDLFTALGHPMRRNVLRRMLEEGGAISPRQLANNLDVPLTSLSYHVRVLDECGAIKLVRTRQIRGSTQHFYRSTLKAEWALSALQAPEKRARKGRPQGKRKADGPLM